MATQTTPDHPESIMTDSRLEWMCFDLLPKEIREILAAAVDDYSVVSYMKWYRKLIIAGNSIEYIAYETRVRLTYHLGRYER